MAETVKNRPQELTKAELEIMQVIWQKEKVLAHDILAELPEPKPAYNTVSTIVVSSKTKDLFHTRHTEGHTSTPCRCQKRIHLT